MAFPAELAGAIGTVVGATIALAATGLQLRGASKAEQTRRDIEKIEELYLQISVFREQTMTIAKSLLEEKEANVTPSVRTRDRIEMLVAFFVRELAEDMEALDVSFGALVDTALHFQEDRDKLMEDMKTAEYEDAPQRRVEKLESFREKGHALNHFLRERQGAVHDRCIQMQIDIQQTFSRRHPGIYQRHSMSIRPRAHASTITEGATLAQQSSTTPEAVP